MTALRPERESAPYGGEAAYGGTEAFEAEAFQTPPGGFQIPAEAFPGAPEPPHQWYAQQTQEYVQGDWYGQRPVTEPSYEPRPQAPYGEPYESYEPVVHEHPAVDTALEHPPIDEETVALRVEEARRIAAAAESIPAPPAPGGRAARRKAARRHGRHSGSSGAHAGPGAAHGAESGLEAAGEASAPLSRVEARRAARARKPSVGVVASRVIGEVFITTGVLMLLFVTYQLWWSNIRAQQQAGREATSLQQEWKNGKRAPGAFEPGQGFAILHIPKLDVVAPIAEGISKSKVLDRGMVGHYDENSIKTAMPEDKTGNFGLAGHRNTHGEPFRYINRLKPGDPIVVETQDTYYVYDMASILPVTPPTNVSVLNPVPPGSGFTGPGRYITLTTCTPEFTSKYRMIVWGKMVEERPRSEGKPDALVQ
ncbi:class E sortase [Streptomyces ipomoeae]|uniref:Class E sortase n=1 Tax=Streptomyces ipomoeae TaxID=103232 RepID=A0AAE8VVE8_9ACTN|nr:class E sortase [Streptomyces ipomoeae]MDX2823264.1 class E sortase [Streptomyces ipomoeae]MDX2875831.1 class E sortase [Streptomyces ipomoeae]TQE21900.1 class E sortase [Streptomyces ipomoeae]TQE34875.1 class E sortase [Streptomyces ipomoeae]